MDTTTSREESRKQFEYEAGKALCLPTAIIELARKGDGYDHAFDSMNIMQPLNGWWHWWQSSRASIAVELPDFCECCYSEEEKGLVDSVVEYCAEALSSAGLTVKGD